MSQRTFGELIKSYRATENITQIEFANLMNKVQSAIAAWENDKSFPSGKDVILLSNVTGIPANDLARAISYAKEIKKEGFREVVVALKSTETFEDLRKKYRFELDGAEVTEEELKKALDMIKFERFSKSRI